jgi:dimeric dUTPase (all-alpha-NTP-PPase superfamily)
MGNIFANKKAAKDDKVESDFMGGGFLLDTDIYQGKIKYAYIGKAANSDARNCTLCIDFAGKEVTKSIWMTNRDGDVTYTDKKTKEQKNLPGYNQINSLAMLLLSKEVGDLDVEEKTLKLYDYDAKADVAQAVDCFVELHGLDLSVAVERQTVDKTEKNESTGDYEPTGETRDVNEFIKFFPQEPLVTLSEVAQFVKSLGGDFDEVLADGDLGKAIEKMEDDGEYATTWLKRNRGVTRDVSVAGKKGGDKGKGKSFDGAKSSKEGGGEKKQKSSLFD